MAIIVMKQSRCMVVPMFRSVMQRSTFPLTNIKL